MKKFICLLLIACAIIPLLVACANGANTVVTTEPTKGDDTPVTTEPITTEYVELPELPEDADYDGYEFLILVSGNYKSNDFEASEDASDIIGQAIWRRNVMLAEKMGVNIANKDIIKFGSSTGSGSGFQAMQQSYTTNSFDYDMCMIGSFDAGVIAYSGYAADLNTLPYVDLERSWWDQRANEELQILGKMFYTTGDISICDNLVTHCLLFNKELIAEDSNLNSPYELVREGKWTYDTMAAEVAKVSVDVNADDKILTLYTCYQHIFDGGRLVVFARLVRDGESAQVDVSEASFNYSARYPQAYYDQLGLTNPYEKLTEPLMSEADESSSLSEEESSSDMTATDIPAVEEPGTDEVFSGNAEITTEASASEEKTTKKPSEEKTTKKPSEEKTTKKPSEEKTTKPAKPAEQTTLVPVA